MCSPSEQEFHTELLPALVTAYGRRGERIKQGQCSLERYKSQREFTLQVFGNINIYHSTWVGSCEDCRITSSRQKSTILLLTEGGKWPCVVTDCQHVRTQRGFRCEGINRNVIESQSQTSIT